MRSPLWQGSRSRSLQGPACGLKAREGTCCVAPGGARAGADWGLRVRLGQSREGGRGQGPAIPDTQSPQPRPLTCPATLDSPPEPRVNIGTGLLSWFNMCYVPTVFWSLTQTPAGLREPMEVRGQLLHWIPVENVSPCVDLDSCVLWGGLTRTWGAEFSFSLPSHLTNGPLSGPQPDHLHTALALPAFPPGSGSGRTL